MLRVKPERDLLTSVPAPMLSVSVVIPTHNRQEKLRNLLSSIRSVIPDSVKSVIVVDDSHSKPDLDEFHDIGVEHVKLNSSLFISRKKNIGWRRASSEFVFFIDDDNVVTEKTLAPLVYIMNRDANVGAVMPAVLYKLNPALVWVYATPFRRNSTTLDLIGRNRPRNLSIEGRLLPTDALPNASLVRKTAIEEVGGFNERLIVNSSLDFAQRLKAKGWKVISNTGATILHDVEVPGRFGWWAAHGSADPDRVRYELRDWFLIMRGLRPNEQLFRLRASLQSLRFILPNMLAYTVRGRSRRALVGSVLLGYVEGLILAEDRDRTGRE